MRHRKLAERDREVSRAIARAIDEWAAARDLPARPEHQDLAAVITSKIQPHLRLPSSPHQNILLDLDPEDETRQRYAAVRFGEPGPVEEVLFPMDPKTDEPADEPIAYAVWPLPDPECLPDV